MKELYGVMALRESINVECMGLSTSIDLSFADGMVGAIPVFDSKEKALEYADGDLKKIFPLRTVEDKRGTR